MRATKRNPQRHRLWVAETMVASSEEIVLGQEGRKTLRAVEKLTLQIPVARLEVITRKSIAANTVHLEWWLQDTEWLLRTAEGSAKITRSRKNAPRSTSQATARLRTTLGRKVTVVGELENGSASFLDTAPTSFDVRGGSLSIDASPICATRFKVSNGAMNAWLRLVDGEHAIDIDTGTADVHLMNGSSCRYAADVRVGAISVTDHTGSVVEGAKGTVGEGAALLKISVGVGTIRLVV